MTFEKRRYEAAKYLLLKDKELSELSLDCFEDEKIFFNRLCRQSLTSEAYASLQAAKALYDGSGNISLDELASVRRAFWPLAAAAMVSGWRQGTDGGRRRSCGLAAIPLNEASFWKVDGAGRWHCDLSGQCRHFASKAPKCGASHGLGT